MFNLCTEFVAQQHGLHLALVSIEGSVYQGWFLKPNVHPIACQLSGVLNSRLRSVAGVKGAAAWRIISFPQQLTPTDEVDGFTEGFVVAASDVPRCEEWLVDLSLASISTLPWLLSPPEEERYEAEGNHEILNALRNGRLERAVWYPVELYDGASLYGHGVFRLDEVQDTGSGLLRYVTLMPESASWSELEMRRYGRHCGLIRSTVRL